MTPVNDILVCNTNEKLQTDGLSFYEFGNIVMRGFPKSGCIFTVFYLCENNNNNSNNVNNMIL